MKFIWSSLISMILSSRPARALWIEIPDRLASPSVHLVEAREGLVIEMYTQPVLRQKLKSSIREGLVDWKFSFPGYASHHISGSRLMRGLWIEIISTQNHIHPCRGPRGPCGLKSLHHHSCAIPSSRPRGPCGLKCQNAIMHYYSTLCRYSRGPCGLEMLGSFEICLAVLSCRGPRGPCGLKSRCLNGLRPDRRRGLARALD